MVRYSLSDLIGTSCYTIENQGILVILNRIGGTVLNAAGGLASTVSLTINQFGSAIIMAFRPQIIKQYAAREYKTMERLMINCSKYAIILFSLFAVPAFLETDFILGVWLKTVPTHTSTFCKIILLASFSQIAVTTLACGIHATGKIFSFSLITGITYIIQLPIIYYLIIITDNPNWAYILSIIQLTINVFIISIMLRNRVSAFHIRTFVYHGFFIPTLIPVLCGMAVFPLTMLLDDGWLRFIVIGLATTSLIILSSWFIILDKQMQEEVILKIKDKFSRS